MNIAFSLLDISGCRFNYTVHTGYSRTHSFQVSTEIRQFPEQYLTFALLTWVRDLGYEQGGAKKGKIDLQVSMSPFLRNMLKCCLKVSHEDVRNSFGTLDDFWGM